MPGLSGVPLPTPISAKALREAGSLAFLVSQQVVANTSDDITGYRTSGKIIWMVNHVFLASGR